MGLAHSVRNEFKYQLSSSHTICAGYKFKGHSLRSAAFTALTYSEWEKRMSDQSIQGTHAGDDDGIERRDFLHIAALSLAGVGGVFTAWPLINQMNPSADVLALASIEIDLSPIQLGQTVKVKWRGKPVYIRRRTPEQIAEEEKVDIETLPDPQSDADRAIKPEWLVMVGVCTHLGCVPISDQGDYKGFFCPCHGSHYDGSGRIRKGPAPTNLEIPPYTFVNDTTILIG